MSQVCRLHGLSWGHSCSNPCTLLGTLCLLQEALKMKKMRKHGNRHVISAVVLLYLDWSVLIALLMRLNVICD